MTRHLLSFREIEHTLARAPAREDLRDARDFLAGEILERTPLPARYDLRAAQSPVKMQGTRGTCTAFTVAAVAEFFNREEFRDPTLDLSEEFLFKKTKEIDLVDYNYDGYGAYLRSAAKAYQRYGLCREQTLPYRFDAAEDSWRDLAVSDAQRGEGQMFRAAAYASVAATDDAICRALVASEAPLLAGFMLFGSYRESRDNGGFFPVPAAGETKIGGHAMALVGYTPTHFILKNSWGTGWGDAGYCYWPRAAMQHVYSVWSFVDLRHPTPQLRQSALTAATQAIVPDWSRDGVAWAAEHGIVTQIMKDPVPDYRLATILHHFEKHLDKKYAPRETPARRAPSVRVRTRR